MREKRVHGRPASAISANNNSRSPDARVSSGLEALEDTDPVCVAADELAVLKVDVVAGAEGCAAGVEGVEEGHDGFLVRHCDDATGEVGAAEGGDEGGEGGGVEEFKCPGGGRALWRRFSGREGRWSGLCLGRRGSSIFLWPLVVELGGGAVEFSTS